MKDWVVAAVDGVSPVDIRRDEIAIALIRPKGICLVCAGMCPQQQLLVEIIRVSECSPWVIRRKAQRVEILLRRHHGAVFVIVLVCRLGEVGLDNLPGDVDRMVGLKMQTPGSLGDDVWRDVEPRLCCRVCVSTDSDC